MLISGLLAILAVVLVLPVVLKSIERQLEIFLLALGILAVSLTGQWHIALVSEALTEPVKITLAVLAAGVLFQKLRAPLGRRINHLLNRLGARAFAFLLVVGLGLSASTITAIIAALVLVEVVSHLRLDRRDEIRLVVFACFAIGLGAALTPLGEPLSTIATAKLKGAPFHAGFWFLGKHLWMYLLSGIVLAGAAAAVAASPHSRRDADLPEDRPEELKTILIRTAKIYFFVAGLVLLGAGFKPLIDLYVSKIPAPGLYWLNMVSAILDNATLAAAEIGPVLSLPQITASLVGLVISGGMLIPGNIPNIIAANKLKIGSGEWARIGVPAGLALMAVYFGILFWLVRP